jgi:amino acid transporter
MAMVEGVGASRGDLLKRLLLGRAMQSGRAGHQLLPKSLALPVLSADALSSVAYTVEATVLVLLGAGGLGTGRYLLPITLAVAVLMVIVVTSYRQTVRAYTSSGGAYVVAKDNLGIIPALIAAASLLAGYILTVAVSVVAGVIAVTSVVPSLLPHKIVLSAFFVLLITVANLRGLRESGILFAIPTYGFILSAFVVISVGVVKCLGDCSITGQIPLIREEAQLDVLVLLQAFAVGSSALTGVEAISNAVTIFRRPQGRNAAQTLGILGGVAVALVIGVAFIAHRTGALPTPRASLLSKIGAAAVGSGHPLFFVFQGFTFAILVLAANTSFQGFPRLAAMMAKDGFLPRQFENLGDRLVLSNGMVVLAAASIVLIGAFEANVERLIPLYAVGVFTAFTLSQAGMVRYWQRIGKRGGGRARGWRRSLAVNGVGAVATAFVVAIVVGSRFTRGVWVVAVIVPVMIAGFYAIRRHYDDVVEQLRPPPAAPRSALATVEPDADNGWQDDGRSPGANVLLLVERLDEAAAAALGYARSFAGRNIRALYIGNERSARDVEAWWSEFCRGDIDLTIPPAAERGPDGIIAHIRSVPRAENGFVTVVVPEFFADRSLAGVVRHRQSFALKLRLMSEPGVVVSDVPMVASPDAEEIPRPLIPARVETLVLVSSVHRASLRALRYARSLRAHDTRAVYFAVDHESLEGIQSDWLDQRVSMELDIVETPFRDLTTPVLEEVRRITAHPGAVASVILPELVVAKRWHHLLHNQKGFFLKRLLLFEPQVVLSSVPYQLR